MPVAVNPSTGEALRLDESGQWVPTKVARNPQTGEAVALDGAEWRPIKMPDATAPKAAEVRKTPTLGEFASGLQDEVVGGASLNFLDEVRAAGRATGAQLAEMVGLRPETETFGQSYNRAKGELNDKAADFRTAYPKTALGANVAGGFVTAAGSAAPAAKTLLGATLQGAKVGGITGAAAGAGAGEGLEDRARGALAGGAVGGTIGAVAPAAVELGKQGWRAVQNLAGWQNPATTADRMLRTTLEREGLTVDRALDRVTDMQNAGRGAPANVADLGTQTQRLARTVQTVPGTGSRQIEEALRTRQQGAGARVAAGVRGTVGLDDQNATLRALRDSRKATAGPLYDKAFASKAPVQDPDLLAMWNEPDFQALAREGLKTRRIEAAGKTLPGPIPGAPPTLEDLHTLNVGINDALDEMRDKVTGRLPSSPRARALVQAQQSLLSKMDTASPDYGAARAAWAGDSASMDAVNRGRRFMRGDVEDVDEFFGGLTPADRDFFLIGLSRELRDMVNSGSSDVADATRRLMQPKVRERLTAFLKPGQMDELQGVLGTERQMSDTFRTATGGSPTGRIMAEQDDSAAQATGFIADLMRGNFTSAMTNLGAKAVTRGRGINEETGAELAQMLLAWRPEELAALRARLMADQLKQQARASLGQSVGRGALVGTATAIPAAMEDRR